MSDAAASANWRGRIGPVVASDSLAGFWRRLASSFALIVLLGGCAEVGDFGRPQPSLFNRLDSSRLDAGAAPGQASPAAAFALTDDERLLRDLAQNLLAPPDGRDRQSLIRRGHVITLAAGEPSAPVHTRYGTDLLATPYRSATARYARLIDDIRSDIGQIGPFVMVAVRVADVDRKREKSLAYVSAPTESERANAVRRMRENKEVVVQVVRSLKQRAASYRYALERLAIETPSPVVVEAERALNELVAQTAAISGGAPVKLSARSRARQGRDPV